MPAAAHWRSTSGRSREWPFHLREEATIAAQFADGRFRFATGIEDTFIPQIGLGRRALDEYELTQHYWFWEADLQLVADSGATTIRYGFPWYRLNPEPGEFRWSWADRVIDRLCELGLEVIVDLVHYGTPNWLDNEFLNRRYPQVVADYAYAFATRYGDRITAWTPLNEPQMNAMRCGESGTWPPHLTGHDGYLQVMKALCAGIVETQRAIAAATGDGSSFVHVEAAYLFSEAEDAANDEATLLDHRRFLSGDLLTGKLDAAHPLAEYLARHGFSDTELSWFRQNPARVDVMGVNFYPMWSSLEYVRGEAGVVRRTRPAWSDELEILLREFATRYDRPVMVTETSSDGPEPTQQKWLEDSLAVCSRLRSEGIEVVGYTWWPFLDQVNWDYRESANPMAQHMHRLGLVGLVPDDVGVLARVPKPLFDCYRELSAKEGARAAPGPLTPEPPAP